MSGKAALSASLVALLCVAPAMARAQVQQGQEQAQQDQALQLTLHFEGEKTDLTDAAKATLDQRIPMFRANPEMRIVIMSDVCAAQMTDDLKMGTDTTDAGQAGVDTTGGGFPPDTSAEQPGDTGGAVVPEEPAVGGEPTDAATTDTETEGKTRELVQKRAEAARDYLVKHGVQSSRIDVAVVKKDHKDMTPAQDDRNMPEQDQTQQGQVPPEQGQQGQNPEGQQGQNPEGQQGQWPQGQQGQWHQGQGDCPQQQTQLKAGEQQFKLLIASQAGNQNGFEKQNQDMKQNQDTTQKQGEQQPY